MYEKLKEKAVENLRKKKVRKKEVHIVGVIFTAVSILLFVVSLNFHSMTAYWIKFPILILALFYGIIYFTNFGIPFISDDDELTDEEIGREMVKIFKSEESEKTAQIAEDSLELKELEALKRKLDDGDEFV